MQSRCEIPLFKPEIRYFVGDLERSEFHIEPPPVLDRHASLSAVQLGFIDNICR